MPRPVTAQIERTSAEAATRGLHVVAYDPGPTPGTGLVRDRSVLVRAAWRLLATPVRFLVPRINTREAAGEALAALALGTARQPAGRLYAALRGGHLTWPEPSELARRDDVMEALWRDSASLVGLPAAPI